MPGVRYLKYSEIDEILSKLPLIPGSNTLSRQVAHNEILQALKLDLSEQLIPDNDEVIKELTEIIYHKMISSIIQPGTPAGVRTAEALGKDVTQATLNSFHYSGTEKGSQGGISNILEILNATRNDKKNQFSRVHFNNEFLSFEEILGLYKDFVGISIRDLVVNAKTLTYEEAYKTNEYYYDLYSRVMKKKPVDGKVTPVCLELQLDLNKIYQAKISSFKIVETLLKNNDNTIKCVAFPSHKGIIHIYPLFDEILEQYYTKFVGKVDITQQENVIRIFVKNIIIPELKNYIISGISGNTNLYPEKLKIQDVIRSMTKYRYPDDEIEEFKNYVVARIHPSKMLNPGISWNRIYKFFEFLGYKVLSSPTLYSSLDVKRKNVEIIREQVKNMPYPNYLVVLDPQDLPNPTDIIKTLSFVQGNSTAREFEKYTIYYFGIVQGNNLIEIISNPLVNSNMTISNNPYQISKIFGIGVARKVLIEQYFETFSDRFINPRNIMNIVNFQTSQGVFLPVTSRGAARHPIGPMTKASFQQATECFVQGAAFGVYENTNSVSTSVYIGKRIKLGSGCMNIIPNMEMYNNPNVMKYPQKIHKQVNKDNIISDSVGEQLNIGDEVRYAGNFNMPPNYPPPKVIPCQQDLPIFFIDVIEIDIKSKIYSAMYQRNYDFNLAQFAEWFGKL